MASSKAICPRHDRCLTSVFGGSFLHERSSLVSSWPGGTEWMGRELRAYLQESSSWQQHPPPYHPSSSISSLLLVKCWLVLGGDRDLSFLWEAQRVFLGHVRAL